MKLPTCISPGFQGRWIHKSSKPTNLLVIFPWPYSLTLFTNPIQVRSKADDPWVSKPTILERIKADDQGSKQTALGLKQTILWVKADDLWIKGDDLGQSGRSRGYKADDPVGQSGQPSRKSNCMKTHDPIENYTVWKQTIFWVKADDPL